MTARHYPEIAYALRRAPRLLRIVREDGEPAAHVEAPAIKADPSGFVRVSWDREYERTHSTRITAATFAKEQDRLLWQYDDELPPGLVASGRLA